MKLAPNPLRDLIADGKKAFAEAKQNDQAALSKQHSEALIEPAGDETAAPHMTAGEVTVEAQINIPGIGGVKVTIKGISVAEAIWQLKHAAEEVKKLFSTPAFTPAHLFAPILGDHSIFRKQHPQSDEPGQALQP